MSSDIFGVIAPHPPIMVEAVGGRRSRVTDASIESVQHAATLLARFDPDLIVIISPHAPAVSDGFAIETSNTLSGSFEQFGAPEPVYHRTGDSEVAYRLIRDLEEHDIPCVDRALVPTLRSGTLDHGVLVPIHFLDPKSRWPLLVLSLSWLSYDAHRLLGERVSAVAHELGRKIAFVASGDCSHRLTRDAPAGFDPRAADFDKQLVELITTSDFEGLSHIDPELIEAAGECGLRSFVTLGGAAHPGRARLLSYEAPWGVGYLTAVVNEPGASSTEASSTPTSGVKGGRADTPEHETVRLARETIERYVTTGQTLIPGELENTDLPIQAGAFVSLHLHGALRGCIGTIAPVRPTLSEEIVRNAVEAAIHDPRFPPVVEAELPDLVINVDVLHEPEPCTRHDLDPSRYGVIVTSGHRRGLLLPDLEGVDTVDQQVDIACRKAGIGSERPFELERFLVDRYV